MAEVSVNSVQPSEISQEMVALYLLASVAASSGECTMYFKDGVPVITGPSKDWILEHYVECLRSVIHRKTGR